MSDTHGKFCGICNKWIRKNKVEQHMAKHAKQEEKRLRRGRT